VQTAKVGTTEVEAVERPDFQQGHQRIVGSWLGTLDNGLRFVQLFTSDGITQLTLPVLTPAHGAWTYVGSRRFAVTAIGVRNDIQTGADQGSAKLRLSLTVHRSGDQMSGTAILDVFAPDGSPAGSFTHTVTFTRLKVEPVD
jgi:hypothetical protein